MVFTDIICADVMSINECQIKTLLTFKWSRHDVLSFKIGTADIRKSNKSNYMLVAFLVQFYLNYFQANVFTVVELPLLRKEIIVIYKRMVARKISLTRRFSLFCLLNK